MNKEQPLQEADRRIGRRKPARMRLRAAVAGMILTVAGVCGAAGAAAAGDESGNPYAQDPNAARQGEELFGRNCQQCHNTRGHGGKCPQLVRGAWAPGGANSDALMFETISKGRPNTQMGAFGGSMSAEEIWQIETFLRAEAARVKAADAKGGKRDDEDLWY